MLQITDKKTRRTILFDDCQNEQLQEELKRKLFKKISNSYEIKITQEKILRKKDFDILIDLLMAEMLKLQDEKSMIKRKKLDLYLFQIKSTYDILVDLKYKTYNE